MEWRIFIYVYIAGESLLIICNTDVLWSPYGSWTSKHWTPAAMGNTRLGSCKPHDIFINLSIHNSFVLCQCLVIQSGPTLCDPMDCSPPGSSVLGILQARILEWVAISFPRESFWSRNQTQVSCIVGRFFTIWATREALNNKYSGLWRKNEL